MIRSRSLNSSRLFKSLATAAAFALCLAAISPASLAGEACCSKAKGKAQATAKAGETVKLAGWITDEWCGAGNAKAEGAECTRACNDKGAKLVLFSDGVIYHLNDQELAKKHIGYKVMIQGEMGEENTVQINKILKATENKA